MPPYGPRITPAVQSSNPDWEVGTSSSHEIRLGTTSEFSTLALFGSQVYIGAMTNPHPKRVRQLSEGGEGSKRGSGVVQSPLAHDTEAFPKRDWSPLSWTPSSL